MNDDEAERVELHEVEVIDPEFAAGETDTAQQVLRDVLAVMARLSHLAETGSVPDHAVGRILAERAIRYAQRALALDDQAEGDATHS